MSIEMHINNTMTVFQRGGAPALADSPPILEQAPLVAKRVAANPPLVSRVAAAPVKSRETIANPEERRSPGPTFEWYDRIIEGYDPRVHTTNTVEPALRALCVPEQERRIFSEKITLLIKIFQLADSQSPTGRLRLRDITRLNGLSCGPSQLNYYEAQLMPMGIRSPSTIALLNSALATGRQLPNSATEQDIRGRIPEVRESLKSKLRLISPLLSNQFTSDFILELSKLSPL
jgi:hypothetical protein